MALLALSAAACGSVSDSIQSTTTTASEADPSGGTDASTTTAPDEGSDSENQGRVVAAGDTVSVHYVGTLDSGEQFDSSRDRGTPLTFAVGSGQMISGFDAAVRGMAVGEIKTVRLTPAEAYGESDPAAFIEVALDQVPEGTQVGDQLIGPTGQTVVVTEINGNTVIIDTNHRLAGEHLTFEIEVVSIDS